MFILNDIDRIQIKYLTKHGDTARVINRAHVLNMRDKGLTIIEVADYLELTPRTIINIANNYEEKGLEAALNDDPRTGRPVEIDDRMKSQIVAMVCSDPPEGFDRWTLELLKEKTEKDNVAGAISKESIRLILKEHDLKPWQQKMWCVPELDETYIERMEDVLDVYERPYNEQYPVICIDEKPVVLQDNKRESIPAKEGSIKKVDYEYIRNGSINVFSAVEPKMGVYINRVTERKKGVDFAKFLASIERKYSKAKKIVLVMDNYSTHTATSLIRFYGKKKGNRIWERFEVHYTPVHASWLNQAEIAIGMYSRQCLGKTRIPDIEALRKKTAAWCKIINKKSVTINWKFNKVLAKEKFGYE